MSFKVPSNRMSRKKNIECECFKKALPIIIFVHVSVCEILAGEWQRMYGPWHTIELNGQLWL